MAEMRDPTSSKKALNWDSGEGQHMAAFKWTLTMETDPNDVYWPCWHVAPEGEWVQAKEYDRERAAWDKEREDLTTALHDALKEIDAIYSDRNKIRSG